MYYQQIISKLYNLSEDANLGYSEAEIAALENRLQIRLPAALRHYYLSLGKNKAVNDTFNRLTSLAEVGFSEDEHLVFYEENQAVVLWGIAKEDLSADNPAVYGTYDSQRSEWFVDSYTTEHFLLSMAWWNGALGGLTYTAFTDLEEDLTPAVIQLVTKNWQEQQGISNQLLRFFTNDYLDIIVLTTAEDGAVNGLYVGTNDEGKYKAVMSTLHLEWCYRVDRDE
ncbi:SMI1/KNR4 family protein SUKH-1 [Chitinophaga niastensis]|uniref:SMI1/KNR4 family protein SUKH-1 n=1 Tax=Chitinophaga niastensis TaxID=536980 RepID=A0A2P8HUS7_CHINA|nr:SMI1/KNR4 family protein [Chitinophaga niastensis]PSL49914.1 SMI1/KNR4 family protein SUKH-1 [Chitinophaga niastensis]